MWSCKGFAPKTARGRVPGSSAEEEAPRAKELRGGKASLAFGLVAWASRLGSAEPAGRGSAPESAARQGLLRGVAGADVFASQVCPALLCAVFLVVGEERQSAQREVAVVAVEEVLLKEAERPRVSG